MRVSIQSNISAVRRSLALTQRQLAGVSVQAMNETAFEVRRGLIAEMQRVFDRPTPFILNSLWVNLATPSRPYVTVSPRDPGGKSVDPNSVLWAEVFGGRRNAKRAERALQRIGVLPQGFGMVPARGVPLDAYGNVSGPFIVQLLSYLEAFGEQGYRSNMTTRRRAQLSRRGRWINGRFVPQEAARRSGMGMAGSRAQGRGGVEYFVSRGKGTWGALPRNGWAGREQHLPAGIWSRTGNYGEDVRPVFLFVRMPSYRQRLDYMGVAERIARAVLPARFDARLQAIAARNALKVAA